MMDVTQQLDNVSIVGYSADDEGDVGNTLACHYRHVTRRPIFNSRAFLGQTYSPEFAMDPEIVEEFLLRPQDTSTRPMIQEGMPGSDPDSGEEEEIYKRGTGGYDVSIPPYDEEDSSSDLALKAPQKLGPSKQASIKSPTQYEHDCQPEGQESRYHLTLPGLALPGDSGAVEYGMGRPACM